MLILLYWIAYYFITFYKLISLFKKEIIRFDIIINLIEFYNNHFTKVINNKNNSFNITLIKD